MMATTTLRQNASSTPGARRKVEMASTVTPGGMTDLGKSRIGSVVTALTKMR